jgi:TRAP-type C4-dicarboxylate transport system substrate-binding protein
MPLNNVTYFVPFGPGNAERVVQAIDYVQTLPELSGEWKKHNVVYLAGFTLDTYGIAAKMPLAKVEDFKGRKIGGAGPNLNWIKNTGAVGVQGSLNSFYNDIKTGVYDGAFTFITAAVPAKLFEPAPYYTELDFGSMYAGAVAVNRGRWDRFPDEIKVAFRKAGNAYKGLYLQEQTARIKAAYAAWEKGGGKIVKVDPAERAKLAKQIPNPTLDWAKQTGAGPAKKVLSAYMGTVRAGGFRFTRDFDKE